MAHDHGNQYQVRLAHEDGTEVLSQWIDREGIAQAMTALYRPGAKAYWLRERKVLCPNCLDTEQRIMEFPLVDSPISTTASTGTSLAPSRELESNGSGVPDAWESVALRPGVRGRRYV